MLENLGGSVVVDVAMYMYMLLSIVVLYFVNGHSRLNFLQVRDRYGHPMQNSLGV